MTFSTFPTLREVERLFDQVLGRVTRELASYKPEGSETSYTKWIPDVDIIEDAETFKIFVDLPGVKREDLNVDIDNNLIVIKGKREYATDPNKETYHLVERQSGCFYRSFQLPNNVDIDKVDAQLTDGVLTVVLPKKPEAQPRSLSIK